MPTRRPRWGWVLALLLWLTLPTGSAAAHANLVKSDPPAGAVVARFPTQARLAFTETVNPANPRASLLNAAGQVVAAGVVTVSDADQRVVLVSLPAQPDGIYSLEWQVQSAVDGHITRGSVAFSVGLNTPAVSVLPPPGVPGPTQALPPLFDTLVRWVGYLAISLMFGSALFGVLIWRPALRGGQASAAAWDDRLARVLRLAITLGAVGAAASLLILTVNQALTEGDPANPLGLRLLAALGHHGVLNELVWLRLIALVLAAGLARLLPAPGRGSARPWWEIVGLGLIALLTYSLTGHNAALGAGQVPPLPVTADGLHLLGMAAWLGGLLPLGLVLNWARAGADPDLQPLLAGVVKRFSRLATVAVGLIALTGLYSALLQVRTLDALTGTRYGQALLVKTGLFALLVGLGAANQLGFIPRLARGGLGALAHLRRTVRWEYGLGLALLLAVGGLMSLEPGYQALQAEYRLGYHQVYDSGSVQLDFRAVPGRVGVNELAVDVVDRRPAAEQSPPTVLFRIQAAQGSGGQTQVEALPPALAGMEDQPGDDPSAMAPMVMPTLSPQAAVQGRWTARGSYFSRQGVWQVEVIWRKPGFDDVRHRFILDLAEIAARAGE